MDWVFLPVKTKWWNSLSPMVSRASNIDVTEMVSRIATFGEDFAKRYISSAQKSAKLKIGSFKLPISILGEIQSSKLAYPNWSKLRISLRPSKPCGA